MLRHVITNSTDNITVTLSVLIVCIIAWERGKCAQWELVPIVKFYFNKTTGGNYVSIKLVRVVKVAESHMSET